MIEGDPQRSNLLERLHQGLRTVSDEVAERETQVDYGPEIVLSVGELSEMRMDPGGAGLERAATYFYYSFRAEFVPEVEQIEQGIRSSIARDRTKRSERPVIIDVPQAEELPVYPY